MATTYKNSRIQGTASTSTYATLYTVPASTSAIVSTIAVCNTAGSQATFRVAIMDSAGTPAAADWLCYDTVVAANDTTTLTIAMALSAGQVIRVSSSANTTSFQCYISEIS